MAVQNNANIGFEKQIWDAACVLWGHIPAAEYRKVIVGLIFLRYISSAFEKRYQQLVEEGDGFEDDKDAYAEDNIFFVPEDARWSKIASAAHTPEIGTVIDDAMRAIEKENTTLKNVLPKNYASPDLDKRVLGEVVDLFTNMDMGDTEESKDLLGRTYEYCIQQFAAYEGVKGGEFYTPASIVKTIVAILKPFKNCRVSTENMLPNKGGITVASSLPTVQLTQEYKKGDVLVSNIRPYFKKIWRAKYDGGCSNDVLVFQGNSNIDGNFLYYVLANDDFHETVAPMFEMISQRQTEIAHLADLRDTLLPKLMSGEIDVSDLNL